VGGDFITMLKSLLKNGVFWLGAVLVSGCATQTAVKVPIIDGWEQGAAISEGYVVQKRDTIYAIAWAFNKDYRELAELNHLKKPYLLRVGMKLRLDGSAKIKAMKSETPEKVKPQKDLAKEINSKKSGIWKLPVKSVAKYHKLTTPAQAIDFAGKVGDAVLATRAGEVVYSGSGLAAYGNLIILKHTDDYFSAYAYNERNLVHEGEKVKAGQLIACLGKNRRGEALLHFEIRYRGRSVAPNRYLNLR